MLNWLKRLLFKLRRQQFAIIVCGRQQPGFQRSFRMGKRFINPTARFD